MPIEVLINGSDTEIENHVKLISRTSATDGMIFDKKDNLYYADLENDKIMKLNIKTNKKSIVDQGQQVKLADTYSIFNNHLFYTNSRINEAKENIQGLSFSINKIKI